MTNESIENFNKRNPRRPPADEPRKRSNHIALLVMGTMAVGGGAYALMPSERCDPNRPTVEQPRCRMSGSSSSSGGHYYGSSSSARSNFASSSSSGVSAVGSSSPSSVARSGFGSFGSHFSGGG